MNILRPAARNASASMPRQFCRPASLNSAIYRGMNHEARSESRSLDRPRKTWEPSSSPRDAGSGDSGDRPQRYGSDRAPRSFDRDSNDRPQRYGSDRAPSGSRSFDRGSESDRAPRSFEQGSGDRPQRFGSDRAPSASRSFDRGSGDRPQRYGSDRAPSAPRSFDRDSGDRPQRYGSDRAPSAPRSFDRDSGDRSQRYGSDRMPSAPRSFDRDSGDQSQRYGSDRASFAPRSFNRDSGDRPQRYSSDRAPSGSRSFDRGSGDRPQRFGSDRTSHSFDRESGNRPQRFGSDRPPRSSERSLYASRRPDQEVKSTTGESSAPRVLNPELLEAESLDSPSSFHYVRKSEPSGNYQGDNRYDSPREYVRTPRRTVQKVNQDSEWIYGTSVVEAALKSQRRKLYRLHVYSGDNRTGVSKDRDIRLKNLARAQNIEVVEVADAGLMDSMSTSRPHNGYILEASPLVKTPIISLGSLSFDKTTFSLQLAQHDFTNSGIVINDLSPVIHNRYPDRHPLVLMLDEILDPGNLGAILRTAYYLGCSAVLLTERNCAPLSPTCLKSSAGASEYIPILTHMTPQRLIEASKKQGWKFFAAVPPPKAGLGKSKKFLGLNDPVIKKALYKSPVVLVMGSEGEGIRGTVRKLCDMFVCISGAPDVDRCVDSLNVSVATGVLLKSFMAVSPPGTAQEAEDATKGKVVADKLEAETGKKLEKAIEEAPEEVQEVQKVVGAEMLDDLPEGAAVGEVLEETEKVKGVEETGKAGEVQEVEEVEETEKGEETGKTEEV